MQSKETHKKSAKTYKRETAWAFIAILCYVIGVGDVELLKVVVWPFMLFIGAAFGMDWATKQTDLIRK